MSDLPHLLEQLKQQGDVFSQLSLSHLFCFIKLATKLKNEILLAQPSNHPPAQPPLFLPPSVVAFLSASCSLDEASIAVLWGILKETVWDTDGPSGNFGSTKSLFEKHGLNLGFSSPRSIWPPMSVCVNPDCDQAQKGFKLQSAQQRAAVLYTLDQGPIPVWSTHLECNGCRINYHHDFYVRAGQRIYYDKIPDVLQIGDHQFAERRLIHLWRTNMNVAWMSAANCAHSYQQSLSQEHELPSSWQFGSSLNHKHVYDGFVLLSLLLDHQARHSTLIVPHTGAQKDRFKSAMRERNARIRLYGQPEVRHRCNKCVRIYLPVNGQPGLTCSCIVIDGVTVGRPTCSLHNCKIPLALNRHRFCQDHKPLNDVCAVVDCDNPVISGKRTCSNPVHQDVERVHTERGQAQFQLKERLKRARVAHPNNTIPEEADLPTLADEEDDDEAEFDVLEEEFDVVGDRAVRPSDTETLDSEGRPDAAVQEHLAGPAKKKIRAQFGRKRTHNEQIIVAPCGMIIARETFYGAEAIPSVVEMIKRTYRTGHIPDHIIYDNNCGLAKHVKNDPDFKRIGLAVDVFHFKSKHSETDTFCQENCNPASFPELIGENGKGWFFNSSIAEQTNVWLGGYHAICREMGPEKYDFFLDEMILIRNEMTKVKLEKKGHEPRMWY